MTSFGFAHYFMSLMSAYEYLHKLQGKQNNKPHKQKGVILPDFAYLQEKKVFIQSISNVSCFMIKDSLKNIILLPV